MTSSSFVPAWLRQVSYTDPLKRLVPARVVMRICDAPDPLLSAPGFDVETGDLLDRVHHRPDVHEEPFSRGPLVLDVHAVERDVHRVQRQAVDRRTARVAAPGLDARQADDVVERRPRDDRQAVRSA